MELSSTNMIFPLLIAFVLAKVANANQNGWQQSTASNFQPSLFVVIGVLSFMFSLTFILLIYAKVCHRHPTAIHSLDRNNDLLRGGMFGTNTRFSGIDKAVVESLPFFKFSSLKGAKQGLQCAVCLAEFEGVEMLRLLPKCKHGFHIECIDQWLENHSTCPLCRQKVSAEDLTTLVNLSSMRFTGGKSDAGEASSNFELFVEREDDQRSSRFSIGSSFRRILNSRKEEEMPMQVDHLHRLNHQIVVSDVMFKNRWSNVSSSDLMFLNSEMLGVMSSGRLYSSNLVDGKCPSTYYEGSDDYSVMNIKEEMERKRMFEHKIGQIKRSDSISSIEASMRQINFSPPRRSSLIPADKRSMSEITALSRFKDLMSMKNKLRQCLKEPENSYDDDNVRDDVKRRRKWFPIAKRTVQWFANREKNRSLQLKQSQDTGQTLNV